MTDLSTSPDLAAIKQRQQATWASGDYHMIGTQIVIVSELLIEALDLRSTECVLDVASGSGNAVLAVQRKSGHGKWGDQGAPRFCTLIHTLYRAGISWT
jgi:hypothetical protein